MHAAAKRQTEAEPVVLKVPQAQARVCASSEAVHSVRSGHHRCHCTIMGCAMLRWPADICAIICAGFQPVLPDINKIYHLLLRQV